jgi:hypothetical protein
MSEFYDSLLRPVKGILTSPPKCEALRRGGEFRPP